MLNGHPTAEGQRTMGNPTQIVWMATAAVILVLVISLAVTFFQLGQPWLRAFLAGGQVSLLDMVMMRTRKTPVNLIVDTYITFVQRGEKVPIVDIERCYLAQQSRSLDVQDLIRLVEAERSSQA